MVLSLDIIGAAGFAHDFRSLDRQPSAVADAFNSLGAGHTSIFSKTAFLFAPLLPILMRLPTQRVKDIRALKAASRPLAKELLHRARLLSEHRVGQLASASKQDKSILSALCKCIMHLMLTGCMLTCSQSAVTCDIKLARRRLALRSEPMFQPVVVDILMMNADWNSLLSGI
jgi:hypothetical protein